MRRSPNCISVGDDVTLLGQAVLDDQPARVEECPTGSSDIWGVRTARGGFFCPARRSEFEWPATAPGPGAGGAVG